MSWIDKITSKFQDKQGTNENEVIIPETGNKTNKQKLKRPTEKESNRDYIADFPNLIDLVEHDGKPVFLVKVDGQLLIKDKVVLESKTFFPPNKSSIPFILPPAYEVIEIFNKENQLGNENADRKLFDDLVEYFKSVSDLPSSKYYSLLATWTILTYFANNFQYCPILTLYAVPERGKSRTGKAITYVSYRGFHTESMREAYILRVSQNYNCTLFLDVMDPWKKAEKLGFEDILLLRFEQGPKIARVLHPDKGPFKDTVFFNVFGPLIIGTNKPLHHILETRSIQIDMPLSSKIFDNDVTPELAMPIKLRLLALKARHMDSEFPHIPKPVKGRLGDMTRPLVQIIQKIVPEYESELLKTIHMIECNRLQDRSESFEAKIILTIYSLGSKVRNGLLTIKDITEQLNDGKPENRKFTNQMIGRRISAFGFSRCKTSNGGAGVIWDKDKLIETAKAYGLDLPSETSDSSETNEKKYSNADVSDNSDVTKEIDLPF